MSIIHYYNKVNESVKYTPEYLYSFIENNITKLKSKLDLESETNKFNDGQKYSFTIKSVGTFEIYDTIDLSYEPKDEYDIKKEYYIEYTKEGDDKSKLIENFNDIKKIYNFLKRNIK